VRIIPAWLREFVDVAADDRQLAEDLTSAGIAVESVQEENGSTVYEMDLTTNRVDAMNHYGVAREASAIYDLELKNVDPKLPAIKGDAHFPIVIEDAQGCARYTARIVRNVKIGPSPENIAKRLELVGSRSINNVADATNYALNELGHPTHAFDLDLLEGHTIIVRRARQGEVLKTLDGVDRKLTTEDLVIADARKPVALAGVMGGFDTMITERTKNVLIESAWFDPATVRSMAKRHGMHTDASHRFERGADYGMTPLASDRVAELILASAGGELHGGRIDAVARELDRPPIPLHRSEIKRNLGIEISEGEIERILRRLGFGLHHCAGENEKAGPSTPPSASSGSARDDNSSVATNADFSVQVPTWRLDIEREVDLLEELARIYGYNNFPNTLPGFSGAVIDLPDEPKNARVRGIMLALGYDEAISITFVSKEEAKAFLMFDENPHSSKTGLSGAPESGSPARMPAPAPLAVANPLNEESAYMRTSLLPGLINMVSYNLNRGTTNVRLFEAGEVFQKLGDGHDERRHLGFAATGDLIPKSMHSAAQPYTFFHMKGDLDKLLGAFQHSSLEFDSNTPSYFHPGRSARAVMNGETVAVFGQLHPEQAATRKLRQQVYIAEVMLDRLYRHPLHEPRYQRISKFPAVERDFSFVFDDAITFERIQSAIGELGLAELQRFVPAEIYRGEKVGAGKYSVLLHAEFQSQERTLLDLAVAAWSAQIIAGLEALGGVLRA
jgi:phenylalanyl-tRNA synthetase beta chain